MKISPSTLCLMPLVCIAGALHAQQQNVSLYGIADLGVQYVSKSEVTSVRSNVTPRFGLRGSEDLGNGLRAEFQLETELMMDEPGTKAMFDRQSWVGLAGVFGQVRFGRTKSLFDDTGDRIDPFDNNGLVGDYTTPVWRVDVAKSRINNDVQWHSPNWNGLRVAAQMSLDECPTGCKTGWGARVIYAYAALELLAAYDAPVVTTVGTPQQTAWVVGGSYRFEPVKFSASHGEGDLKTDSKGKDRGTSKGTTIGLEGKLGPEFDSWRAHGGG